MSQDQECAELQAAIIDAARAWRADNVEMHPLSVGAESHNALIAAVDAAEGQSDG
jgi:hypothetical protein